MESGVVVGYDRQPAGERVLAEAAAEADRRGVALTLVHAPGPDVLADRSSEADLLVLGHRGHGGFLRRGSGALRTLARATCPAMVVRGSERQTRGTVVAAVDVAHETEELLDFAFAEAASRGARLKAVCAPSSQRPRLFARRASGHVAERVEEALEHLLKQWPERYPGVETDYELIEGSPTAFLAGATTYADLVVVGAHRRTDGRRGMKVGPVATMLVQHADCPVAVVPHD